jgi:uncharacterized protein
MNISEELQKKYENLTDILKEMQSAVVAFSGGVDSTLLLKVAHQVLGVEVLAVIAASATYPEGEVDEAVKLAQEMQVRHQVIESQEMEIAEFVSNPPQRCYYCKTELFSKIIRIAEEENIPFVLDGANFEDLQDFRPGSQAAQELGIRSPLKEAELTKADIRDLSQALGLSTWDKPSMACLSSRFPYYTEINSEGLIQVGKAEEFLRSLGFSQIRVRHHDNIARIEVLPDEIPQLAAPGIRAKIVDYFNEIGYTYITLDLAGYRSGSLNESLSPAQKGGHDR